MGPRSFVASSVLYVRFPAPFRRAAEGDLGRRSVYEGRMCQVGGVPRIEQQRKMEILQMEHEPYVRYHSYRMNQVNSIVTIIVYHSNYSRMRNYNYCDPLLYRIE